MVSTDLASNSARMTVKQRDNGHVPFGSRQEFVKVRRDALLRRGNIGAKQAVSTRDIDDVRIDPVLSGHVAGLQGLFQRLAARLFFLES